MNRSHLPSDEQPLQAALGRRAVLGLACAPLLLAAGCGHIAMTTGDKSPETRRREINAGADNTLNRLYQEVRGSRELAGRARGILVFPSILAAGLLFGGEYGEGVLRSGGRAQGYYRIASGSFGFQAGAQSKAVVMLFMTEEALAKFRSSNGWQAGVDASVALVKIGANGEIDTNSVNNDVNVFALTNAGLMYNLTVEGTKITRLDL